MKQVQIALGSFLLLTTCTSLPVQQKTVQAPQLTIDARKIASVENELPTDYPEIALDPTLEELPRLAKSIQDFILSLDDLVRPTETPGNTVATETADLDGQHCNNLWRETCAKKVGFDPTGFANISPDVEFDDLVPGYRQLVQPKIYAVLQFIYGNDEDYQFRFRDTFPGKGTDVNSRLQCMAEFMAQRTIMEYSSFPLHCYERDPRNLRNLIGNPNSIYLENRVRRALRAKFPQTAAMKKIEFETFPRVRKLITAKIKKYSAEPVRSQIIKKLEKIEFRARDCRGFGQDNASYDSAKNTFTICWGSLLQNTSIFNRVSVIAHELTHAFDPCVISIAYPDFHYSNIGDLKVIAKEFPFGKVVTCLARTDSAEARMLSNPPEICKSQFGESFADAMAAEVLAEYIRRYEKKRITKPEQFRAGVENIWRTNCSAVHKATRAEQTDVHPRTEDRVNGIIALNPQLRKLMGCTPKSLSGSCPIAGGGASK